MKQTRGKKRLLAMLLALVMCLGLLPMGALAARIMDDEIAIEAPGSSVAEEVPAKPLDANAERAVSDGAVTVSAPDKDLSIHRSGERRGREHPDRLVCSRCGKRPIYPR